jgi:hypothetical protein
MLLLDPYYISYGYFFPILCPIVNHGKMYNACWTIGASGRFFVAREIPLSLPERPGGFRPCALLQSDRLSARAADAGREQDHRVHYLAGDDDAVRRRQIEVGAGAIPSDCWRLFAGRARRGDGCRGAGRRGVRRGAVTFLDRLFQDAQSGTAPEQFNRPAVPPA